MNAKKMLIQLLTGASLLLANVLWGFPIRSVQSSPQLENQIFLPLVQRASLLPNSLYYIQNGQIYRMERDGVTITQITFEPESVLDFDISPLTGKMAYSLGDQLILADANGANREVLAVSDSYMWFSPNWSPDGQMLAYGNGGSMYFFDIASGLSDLVLGNNGDGLNYSPYDFSPDGQYLIVVVKGFGPYQTGAKTGIYSIVADIVSFLAPAEPSGLTPCYCSPVSWSSASDYIYISDFVPAGPVVFGLWRYASDGTGNNLLVPPNKATAPWQEPDGDLVFLFSSPETGIEPDAPFYLVRNVFDGVSDHVVLRPETFYASPVSLWTPDGSALVLVQSIGENDNMSENMVLVPVNSSSPIITLLEDARGLGISLHWGP